MADAMECSSCGSVMDDDHRFCGACGSSLLLSCAACGTENRPTFRFCSSCGAALGAPVRTQPTEARRWVTVLFADISGFTSLSEQMDPEDVTAMVDTCMRQLGDVVESFGGYVEKVVGDEIMALFGAPISHEDDAARAVRAGLEMQAVPRDAGAGFAGLRLRVGINTGEVMFAPVGPETARRFTVMGDPVNTAARLEAAAPVGGVLVGEATYRAARSAIRFDPVEPVRAKNKEQPVEAWLAVAPLAAPVDRHVVAAPLVGRDSEVALLRSLWERVVADRSSHLVTLIGPPGIGKSRLARDVVASLDPVPGAVLRGRSLAYGDAGGYGPFAQQVKQAADVYETLDAASAAQRLRERVASLIPGPQAEEVAGHLALLAGIGTEARTDKPTLFFSARRFVEALAGEAPTVLVFEDIHWADAAMLDLIESLAGRLRGAPVLVLCLARPDLHDIRPQWGGGLPAFTVLPLEPLSDDDTATIVRHITSAHDEVDIDLAQLASTAGGNPLFIEELVASVVEGVAASVGELPTTVRGIIAARLDALPVAGRDALSDASIVGKVFWRSVVESLGGLTARNGVEVLEERDFIRREPVSRLEGDDELAFRHVLTRDVAYGMIPKAARRERHGAVARILESTVGDRASEWAAALAHHHREAGNDLEAARYLELAADVAGQAWAKDQAIALCDEALELVSHHDRAWRERLIVRKAALHGDRGDFQTVITILSPLLPSLEGARKLEALLLCARAEFWLTNTSGARRYCDEAEAVAEAVGDTASMGAALAVRILITSADGHLEEGLAIGERALPLLSAPERPSTTGVRAEEYAALVLSHSGLHHYWLGDHARSAAACRRGYEIGLAQHNLEAALVSGAQYGMALAGSGRYEDAFRVFGDVLVHGQEIELLPRLTGRVVAMWGGALRELQDLEGARRLNEEAGEMGRRSAFPNTQAQSSTDLLLLDVLAGELGAARAKLPLLVAQVEGLRGWHQWLVNGRVADLTARLHLAAGEHAAAAEAAEDSIRQAAAVGRVKYVASGRTVLAQALARLGRVADARSHAEEAHRLAAGIGHLSSMWESADVVSRLAERVGDEERARAASCLAADAVARCADGLAEQRRKLFLAAPPIQELLQRTSW